ncbi:MAG: alpha-galactosidase [bacterium]
MTSFLCTPNITITPEAILILGENSVSLARLNLKFRVNDDEYQVKEISQSDNCFIGTTNAPGVTVKITPVDNSICVELCGSFDGVASPVYFCDSPIDAQYGRTFVGDDDCKLFTSSGNEDIYLTNSGMYLETIVKKHALWMVAPPPHIMSFGDGNGWFGLSIPEPMPVVYTHIQCKKSVFDLTFSSYSPSHDGGRMPRVYIDAGLADSKSIIDMHIKHAETLNLVDKKKKTYSWWYNPIYCTWGDQCYLSKVDKTAHFNEEALLHFADGIRKIYPGEVNYIIDDGWFNNLGDFQQKTSEFGTAEDFKNTIAKLKAKGFRVILWFTPFWTKVDSDVEKEHPEYLVRATNGDIYRDMHNRGILDYSNPEVRDYIQKLITFMLDTLDADGFKIDMNFSHPLMTDITLYDGTWGYGSLMWLNVAKFIHKNATAIKPDAFVTISGIESYLQPYTSSVRLNDLFDFYHAEAWYNRAELVTRLMPNVPVDVDGWPSSVDKMREYQFVSPVFGAPVTYYIDGVDILSVKMTDVDYNRMASVWHVYSQAHCEYNMQVTMDNDTGTFERRSPDGKLRAIALQKSVLVTFTDDKIFATANCNRAVSIPVDNPSAWKTAVKVYRCGKRESVKLFTDNTSIILNMEDAGSGILCYKVSK